GIALHNYHDAKRSLPSGHVEDHTQYFTCWSIELLPYIEQENLYKQYNQTIPNTDLSQQAFCKTPVTVYTCPTDTRANQIFMPETISPDGGSNPNLYYMASSYRVMTGLGDVSGTNTFGGFWNEVQAALRVNPSGAGAFHGDGQSGLAPERFETIIDGTS